MSALAEFERSSIVAIIRTKTSAEGRSAAYALQSAGITSFEFTTTTPDVFDLIEEFSAISGLTVGVGTACLLYTSPSPRDRTRSRMPSSA